MDLPEPGLLFVFPFRSGVSYMGVPRYCVTKAQSAMQGLERRIKTQRMICWNDC